MQNLTVFAYGHSKKRKHPENSVDTYCGTAHLVTSVYVISFYRISPVADPGFARRGLGANSKSESPFQYFWKFNSPKITWKWRTLNLGGLRPWPTPWILIAHSFPNVYGSSGKENKRGQSAGIDTSKPGVRKKFSISFLLSQSVKVRHQNLFMNLVWN